MTQRNLIALLAAVTLAAFGLASAAEAAAFNGSKSNSFKTAADCSKAGGKWGNYQEGLGCYMPVKPAAAGKTTPK